MSDFELEAKRKNPRGNIPANAFILRTRNSVYRFGEADKSGERTICRDDKPFKFNRCRILFLVVGEPMEFEILNGPKEKQTFVMTSRVLWIK